MFDVSVDGPGGLRLELEHDDLVDDGSWLPVELSPRALYTIV